MKTRERVGERSEDRLTGQEGSEDRKNIVDRIVAVTVVMWDKGRSAVRGGVSEGCRVPRTPDGKSRGGRYQNGSKRRGILSSGETATVSLSVQRVYGPSL